MLVDEKAKRRLDHIKSHLESDLNIDGKVNNLKIIGEIFRHALLVCLRMHLLRRFSFGLNIIN